MNPVVLASSPLVGAEAMQGVAERLRWSGREVAVPDVPPDLDESSASVPSVVRPTVDEARRRGWPVVLVDGAHHLWPVVESAAVAGALAEMIDRLFP